MGFDHPGAPTLAHSGQNKSNKNTEAGLRYHGDIPVISP
jgi:hypothetical protein